MLTRIAVLVSGGGTNLQALIDAQKSGTLRSGEIVLVLSSNPHAFALTRARENNIPSEIVERHPGGQAAFEQALSEILEKHRIELVVLAGFLSILSGDFTVRWPRRILNVHPSLIPSFCGKGYYGLRVHEAALSYGVKVTGATVHFVNEIPDGGQILMQKAIPVEECDTPAVLQERVMRECEWKLLPAATELAAREIQEGKA